MLVRLAESSNFLFCACRLNEVNASLVDSSRHSHHNVLEAKLVVVDIASCRECELLATHGSLDHLNSVVCRALERAASTELDDVRATLYGVVLDLFPTLSRKTHL